MQKSALSLETSLQAFFFDQLQAINKKSSPPLPNETIFYSSLVMDRFGDAQRYFEVVDGKVRNKILGIKLLEATHLSREKQKMIYRDVAETSLLLCGYFSDSMNRKIIDIGYYQDVGITAYQKLNGLVPEAYDIPDFFKHISYQFSKVTNLMTLISAGHGADPQQFMLIVGANRKAS